MWTKYKAWIIGAAVVLVVGVAAFSYGRNTASDNTAGLAEIRTNLQRVIDKQSDIIAEQHKISTGLDSVVKGSEAIEARSARIEGTVSEIAGRVNEDRSRLIEQQRLIEEGKSITGGGK